MIVALVTLWDGCSVGCAWCTQTLNSTYGRDDVGGPMNGKQKTRTSRFISLVLRHRPEAAGVELDAHGWANVSELIEGVNGTGRYHLDLKGLVDIVETDEKRRYSFDASRTRIRANQGHSVHVDVELDRRVPPDVLFHGTAENSAGSIEREGLLPMGRLYVHLSPDEETAVKVGRRHGRPVVYCVDSQRMVREGHEFLLSENGVWLTKAVPPQYLSRCIGPSSARAER